MADLFDLHINIQLDYKFKFFEIYITRQSNAAPMPIRNYVLLTYYNASSHPFNILVYKSYWTTLLMTKRRKIRSLDV